MINPRRIIYVFPEDKQFWIASKEDNWDWPHLDLGEWYRPESDIEWSMLLHKYRELLRKRKDPFDRVGVFECLEDGEFNMKKYFKLVKMRLSGK